IRRGGSETLQGDSAAIGVVTRHLDDEHRVALLCEEPRGSVNGESRPIVVRMTALVGMGEDDVEIARFYDVHQPSGDLDKPPSGLLIGDVEHHHSVPRHTGYAE